MGLRAAVIDRPRHRLVATPLDHSIDVLGWRVEEPDGRRLHGDRLDALGIAGPDRGRLVRGEAVLTPSGTGTLEDVSEPRPGQRRSRKS